MTYKEFVGLYSKDKTPEQGFTEILEAVNNMPKDERVRIKASLDREMEVFHHLEEGRNVLSIMLTLLLAIGGGELWMVIMLLVMVILVTWLISGTKGKYVYLLSVVNNV